MRKNDPRQKHLVDKRVQGALARQMLKHWLIFFVASCAITVLFQYLLDPFQSFGQVMKQFWTRQGPFVVVAVLLFPVFALDSIKLSHRVVGPLVRVRNTLKKYAMGEPVQRIRFRPNDFFQEMAEEVNIALGLTSGPADDRCETNRPANSEQPAAAVTNVPVEESHVQPVA